MSENVRKGYQEITAIKIGDQAEGSRIRITGILLSQNDSILVIGDKTGEIEVEYDDPRELKDQQIVRVFGETHKGRIIAEKVVQLNLDFDLFNKMQNLSKKLHPPS